ncbi:conserved hypothetical protein [Candidatus Sulfopaludibacter sp. SbA4]|nr:conserved hypothetical protein [Candidatus Sulfopaludibacter sp. SbA4]
MLLVTFVLLQTMDALTTVAFLHMGVSEANPLIRLALDKSAGYPAGQVLALAAPKLFAVALGAFAWRSGRKRLLLLMDILFSLCVAWNAAIILLKL